MSSLLPEFGVVVPIRNEAETLKHTLPLVLAELQGTRGRLVCVCNDCTDDSAAVVRAIAGSSATVIELQDPGKTFALQTADESLGSLFPRIYLDADVMLAPGSVSAMLRPLLDGAADLVAIRRAHATEGVSFLSAEMARTWDALPFARQAGFLGATGVSRAGRAAWGRWPNVLGDDIFVAASIAADRRLILSEISAKTRPPPDFWGWVVMRARWRWGESQLRSLGLVPPNASGQRKALIRRLLTPSQALGAWAFLLARLLVPFVRRAPTTGWIPNRRKVRS